MSAYCAVVGLDLSIRTYPAGDPIRDRAQLALLERLRARLHPTLRWRTEVPLPIEGDLRAWDAEIRPARLPLAWARVEAETRIADGQALERKLALKLPATPGGHLILLVADTSIEPGRGRCARSARSLRELPPSTRAGSSPRSGRHGAGGRAGRRGHVSRSPRGGPRGPTPRGPCPGGTGRSAG